MFRGVSLLSFVALIAACEGEVQVPPLPDVDMATTIPDADPTTDASTMDEGTTVDPACVGVTCGTNAVCGRGSCWCAPGFMGDPNIGCAPGNPCEMVECRFGATCRDSGECVCDIGFEENLGNCEVTPIAMPLERTTNEVCQRWMRDYPESAGVQWQTEPADQCSPGELDPAYELDAVRRVSLYRWLVGLPGVTTTDEYAVQTQACATALDAHNMGATNTITQDFACYSENAATGANNSSVLRAAESPAAAVDTFIEDSAATSLGNRRWILNPDLGATAFGFRGDYTCMYATDANGSSNPQYIAYPYGVFPEQAPRGRWMWSSSQLFTSDATTVTVTDPTGANVSVTNVVLLEGNVFPAAVAWEMPPVEPGEYTVTVQGLSGAESEVTYPVNLVACP